MIVVMDTNTVLQAMARQNPLRPLIAAWLTGSLVWAVSTDILLEYEEIFTSRSGRTRWVEFAAMLDVMRELHPSKLPMISPAFRFQLISGDADDNKFADCAIAASADFILTEDHHFDVMRGSGYKPQPVTPTEFIRLHLGGG